MTEKEYSEAIDRLLFKVRDAALRAMVSGDYGELRTIQTTDKDAIALYQHIEHLGALREEERWTRCMEYMEQTRPFWQGLCGKGQGSVDLMQRGWEREAREKFGYTCQEWATPCYKGSSKKPLMSN